MSRIFHLGKHILYNNQISTLSSISTPRMAGYNSNYDDDYYEDYYYTHSGKGGGSKGGGGGGGGGGKRGRKGAFVQNHQHFVDNNRAVHQKNRHRIQTNNQPHYPSPDSQSTNYRPGPGQGEWLVAQESGRPPNRQYHDGRRPPNYGDGDRYNGESRTPKHPAHLKGRDIGLYYANLKKKIKNMAVVPEVSNRVHVELDAREAGNIAKVLHRFKDTDLSEDAFDQQHNMNEPSTNRHKWQRPIDQSKAAKSEHLVTNTVKLEIKDEPSVSGAQCSSAMVTDDDDECDLPDAYQETVVKKEETLEDDDDLESEEDKVCEGENEEICELLEVCADDLQEELEHVLEEFGPIADEEVPSSINPIARNAQLDSTLIREMATTLASSKYQDMMSFRERLPAFQMRDQIVSTIRDNQVVVISGETGCGKTTQVPQFILEDQISRGDGSLSRIVVTQPRRISAISVADRVASERGEKVGGSVGFQIRLEKRIPSRDRGCILFCTTGVVLQWLRNDPDLKGYSHILLDEIHERDVQTDMLMALLKLVLQRRPDLHIVLMSATLNAARFSEYFNGCPMLNIPGRTFPVEATYLEDVIQKTSYRMDEGQLRRMRVESQRLMKNRSGMRGRDAKQAVMDREQDMEAWLKRVGHRYSLHTHEILRSFGEHTAAPPDLIAHVVNYIIDTTDEGAILVFVPGMADIKAVIMDLRSKHPNRYNEKNGYCRLYPLHSSLPTINQREVFERPPPGNRKIIVSTNIAETSITIDDVVYVVDSGRIKMTDFDVSQNTATLTPVLVSKANAAQRRGRAGRVQPGKCMHLFSSFQEKQMKTYQAPEILRIRLENVILQIKLLDMGITTDFLDQCMDAPSRPAIQQSLQFLVNIQALQPDEQLTPLGWHLAHLPIEPQCAKMILYGALFCCLDPVLTVAACLSYRDPFMVPFEKQALADIRKKILADESQSDHILFINVMKGYEKACSSGNGGEYCWKNFLSESTMRQLQKLKKEYANILCERRYIGDWNPKNSAANKNSNNLNLVRAVICGGLYPNIVQAFPPNTRKAAKADNYCVPRLQSRPGESCADMHPSSVNKSVRTNSPVWMAYFKKMQLNNSKKASIFDTTVIPSRPILFFGGNLMTKRHQGNDIIMVDQWINFSARRETARMLTDLRQKFIHVLNNKIANPDLTNWDQRKMEGSIMSTLIDVLSKDE